MLINWSNLIRFDSRIDQVALYNVYIDGGVFIACIAANSAYLLAVLVTNPWTELWVRLSSLGGKSVNS